MLRTVSFISPTLLLLLFSCPVVSNSLWANGLQHARLPCLPKFMLMTSVMPSSHLIFWCPLLLLPPIFSSIRDFSNESFVHQKTRILDLQFQYQSFQWIFRVYLPKDWLVWSPCCPRDFQESSVAPHFKGIKSLAFYLLYRPALTTICSPHYLMLIIIIASFIKHCHLPSIVLDVLNKLLLSLILFWVSL